MYRRQPYLLNGPNEHLYESLRCFAALDDPLKQVDTGNGTNDARQHIQYIMVTVIHCGEPDAAHHDGEEKIDPAQPVFDAVEQDDQRVRGMQGWHGRKYIGAFAVEGMKDIDPEKSIEPFQSARIARCGCQKIKTMQLHIPGWCGRIHIIDHKTHQVNEQESE